MTIDNDSWEISIPCSLSLVGWQQVTVQVCFLGIGDPHLDQVYRYQRPMIFFIFEYVYEKNYFLQDPWFPVPELILEPLD